MKVHEGTKLDPASAGCNEEYVKASIEERQHLLRLCKAANVRTMFALVLCLPIWFLGYGRGYGRGYGSALRSLKAQTETLRDLSRQIDRFPCLKSKVVDVDFTR